MLSRVSHCRRRALGVLHPLRAASRTLLPPRVRCITHRVDQAWRLTPQPPQDSPRQLPRPKPVRCIPSEKVLPEDALKEALAGRGEALYGLLASHLQAANHKAIIELYDQYACQYSAKQQTRDGEQPKKDELDPALSQALLCAISAHAAEGSFKQLLQAYLKAGGPRIPYDLRGEHLQHYSKEKSIGEKTQSYIEDLTSAHFVLKPTDLARYLISLKKANMTHSLTRLYEGILDGITRPEPFISPSESHEPRLPVAMTDSSWASFISAWVTCQRPDLAQQIFQELKKLNVYRGPASWTAYLQSFYHARDYDAAIEAWKEMHRDGTKPDTPAYQFMITLLFRASQPREALGVFAEFQNEEKIFATERILAVYNSVVDGLLRSKLLPQAEQFLEMMKARGMTPDVVTYNSFLSHFGRAKDFKSISNIMARMGAEGIKSDVYSFSTILSSLLGAGRKDAVDVVLQCMKEQGVQANVVIYSAMIDDQLRGGDEAHWRAGMALLRTMERNEKISPNNVTYTTVLTHLYRPNWLTPAAHEAYCREVLGNMDKRGLRFTLPDYHILISTCFENPTQSNVNTALRHYQAIKKRGIPCTQATYYILLSGLATIKEWGAARAITRDITFKDINPSLRRVIDSITKHTQ